MGQNQRQKPFNFHRLQCIPPMSDAIEMVYYWVQSKCAPKLVDVEVTWSYHIYTQLDPKKTYGYYCSVTYAISLPWQYMSYPSLKPEATRCPLGKPNVIQYIYICITHIYIYVCTYIHHCLVVSPHPSLITNNYTAFLHRATWKTCRSSNIQAAAVTALGSTVRECWQSCIEFNAKQGG